jgi:Zn-dependent protease
MKDIVKRALTRKRVQRGRIIVEEPNPKLVWGVKFAIGMTVCLSALEVAHLVVLGSWSSEIFSTITGLIGTVSGVLIGSHA